MAEFQPPFRVTVTVTGRTQRQANIGAGLIAWALHNAGVPFAELDNVDTFDLDFSNFNPVLLGDMGFRISAAKDQNSD